MSERTESPEAPGAASTAGADVCAPPSPPWPSARPIERADGSEALELRLPGPPPSPALRALLAHDFQSPELKAALEPGEADRLGRILPRLLSFTPDDSPGGPTGTVLRFAGEASRLRFPLLRLTGAGAVLTLEEIATCAADSAFLLGVLSRLGLRARITPAWSFLDPGDPLRPLRFVPLELASGSPLKAWLELLRTLTDRSESDEAFRARHLALLSYGFSRFGPAATTPEFQGVELRMWRLLGGLAARLRVISGRLAAESDRDERARRVRELETLGKSLHALMDLPGRLAALYRREITASLGGIAEVARAEVEALGEDADVDVSPRLDGIDQLAERVYEIRALGKLSPLEVRYAREQELAGACGADDMTEAVPPAVRHYDRVIYAGRDTWDARRFSSEGPAWDEEDLELDLDDASP